MTMTHHKIGYKYMKDFYTVEKDGQVFMHIFLTNSVYHIMKYHTETNILMFVLLMLFYHLLWINCH